MSNQRQSHKLLGTTYLPDLIICFYLSLMISLPISFIKSRWANTDNTIINLSGHGWEETSCLYNYHHLCFIIFLFSYHRYLSGLYSYTFTGAEQLNWLCLFDYAVSDKSYVGDNFCRFSTKVFPTNLLVSFWVPVYMDKSCFHSCQKHNCKSFPYIVIKFNKLQNISPR